MNKMSQKKFGMGASVLRKEDDALIKGAGQFTDDIAPDNCLFGYVLRSPYAHARFKIEDLSSAKQAEGIHLVLTADDIKHLKPLPHTTDMENEDGSSIQNHDIPILCNGIVRHVGDAISFIVADSAALAKDASELIEIDFEDLSVIADTAKALDEDAALVYPETGSNLAFTMFLGDKGKTQEAFAKAASVSEVEIINNRLICNYMEPRSCLSEWNGDAQSYVMTVCSQGVHGIQDSMATCMGIDKENIRVITPDVGGGFGTKVFSYREYPLTMEAARILSKPVKWTCDRSEHFVADAHGRDNIANAKIAMDKNGKFLAIKVDLIAAMGAYLHAYGPYIPYLGMTMTTGLYDIPIMAVTCKGVYTHTTPTDAYRGAGRPEASYLLERLVDKCAIDLGLSPDEIRSRNFIKPDQLPYMTPGKRHYDTGEFSEHMMLAMERSNWAEFSTRNAVAETNGKFRGIGMATYIEACAFKGSEPAFLTLLDNGKILLRIGTQTNGQGHATAYSQLAADKLGVDLETIEVHQGDTDALKEGGGTGGSRSVPLGGVSVVQASETLADNIKKIAAEHFEVGVSSIELKDDYAWVKDTNQAMGLAEIALKASDEEKNTTGEFKQAEATYPNGTHICEVEIDPETGVTEIVAYTIVDDFGATVNPILLAGQVHGGVVQSIGQCLTERVFYDDEGQLLSASFMDYGMPRAADIPNFYFETRNVPSTTNIMGMKGAGEAGTIGACPAVMNAMVDALNRKYGITHIDMPALPDEVWALINSVKDR